MPRSRVASPSGAPRRVACRRMRVLVTGAAGFVGRAVVQRLVEAGDDVTAVTRRPWSDHPGEVRHLVADVLDARAVAHAVEQCRPQGVCHLAAVTAVRESFKDPTRYFAVNVSGTIHVLQALARFADRGGEPPRFVFGSTAAVYGTIGAQPIAEDAPSRPTNPYGTTKLAADHLIGFQAATGALAAVSLRCFNVAGATAQTADDDLTRVIPKALAVVAGREPYLVMNGDGSSVRDYLHVADLADAYKAALDAAVPAQHRIYNTGSGLPVSLNDVISSVERITGRQVTIRRSPPQNEPPALLADTARIRRELAWEPRRSDLDTIIGDAWEVTNPSASG
ncbi:MAG: NAD-dependent epimerase/dehydratase family protein [Solirubrobacteraceae bacterium]